MARIHTGKMKKNTEYSGKAIKTENFFSLIQANKQYRLHIQ
jgi:hypothetical protein